MNKEQLTKCAIYSITLFCAFTIWMCALGGMANDGLIDLDTAKAENNDDNMMMSIDVIILCLAPTFFMWVTINDIAITYWRDKNGDQKQD